MLCSFGISTEALAPAVLSLVSHAHAVAHNSVGLDDLQSKASFSSYGYSEGISSESFV